MTTAAHWLASAQDAQPVCGEASESIRISPPPSGSPVPNRRRRGLDVASNAVTWLMNATDIRSSVALSASYTSGGAANGAAPVVLLHLLISGLHAIPGVVERRFRLLRSR